MSAELLDTITWWAIGGTYLVGVINIVLAIRGRRRPAVLTDNLKRSGASSSTQHTSISASDDVDGGAK